jgi:hypothetical protein
VFLLKPAIIQIIFFWILNTFPLSLEFSQKITPYNAMECSKVVFEPSVLLPGFGWFY